MAIDVIDLDGGIGVTLKASGVIDDDIFLQTLKYHLTGDEERFRKYRYSIPDYSDVTEVKITNEAIYGVTEYCKRAESINPNLVVALIAKKDLIFGLARMYQMLFNEKYWISSIFRDVEESREWIRKMVNEKFGISGLTFTPK